ncbi:MAG: RagB/SusD family nutrient uptake outer membrane protein [Arcticibacter sp.]
MKMTKRLFLSVGMMGIMLAISSCEKNVFEEPYSSLSPADAFGSADRIEKSAVGMYDQLQNLNFFGGRVLIYADIRGIDTRPTAYFGQMPNFNTLLSSDATTAEAWEGAYRTIYEANNFMKNLAANPGRISDAQTAQFNSEAKFIRSLCYFYLVNLWAQPYKFTPDASHYGVPLILTATDSPFDATNQVGRNTVAEVYTQMETDLLEAEAGLPVSAALGSKDFTDVARATKGAAQALLARIYLYKGDYAKAVTYSDKVLAGPYKLNASPVTAFRNPYTTDENIFSVAMNGADNPNTNNAIAQHYAPDKRADIAISPEYVALMSVTDLRRTELTRTYAPSPGLFFTTKYTGISDWVPVIRLSEILLTKAEALANIASGVDATAVSLLNEVHRRSDRNAAAIAPASKQALVDAILLERRIELAFEGQGIFEFLRTGRGIPTHGAVSAQAYGSNYVVLPIPKYDTDKSPILQSQQNPGY